MTIKIAFKFVAFVDDTFPANRKRFIKILELIKEKNLKFVWTCMANVNDLDEEILKLTLTNERNQRCQTIQTKPWKIWLTR